MNEIAWSFRSLRETLHMNRYEFRAEIAFVVYLVCGTCV